MKRLTYFHITWISLALFLLLTMGVISDSHLTTTIDTQLMSQIDSIRTPSLTQFFILVTNIGSPLIISLMATILIFATNYKSLKNIIYLLIYYFGTSALGLVLKHVFMRSRPDNQILADTGFSYPSGHALCITLFLFLIIFLVRKSQLKYLRWGIILLTSLAVLADMFSRVYLRDHFPTDIFASFLLSSTAYSIFMAFYLTFFKHKHLH